MLVRSLSIALATLLTSCPAGAVPGGVISGTAFLYNDRGDMFTSRHVIEKCRPDRIVVGTSDGRASGAVIIAKSDNMDLAAISTDIKQNEFASVRAFANGFVSLPDTPEDVFTAGYSQPFENSFTVQLKWGQIQGFLDAEGKRAKTSFENIARMDVDYGASGSPVLDYAGTLVGIVHARSLDSAGDGDQLKRSGYGDKWVRLYNNDALVAFAKEHSLKINAWSNGTRKDPMFISDHLKRITSFVACLPA